ncbi:hypothetical protein [Actinacidiphila paucisporea]|uniref:FG-GAP repeat protein n=1 Tax=Actinacidiphila paucisporea TaxID=310782 RepID=A0A1M6XRV5_9ACTN|nr:hypothetical protein [Actinacidiphila paucisporea]SHL08623.1 hypothetical protein SAMN05216499_102505 [Actinacidiphila paucisporea]
MGRPRRAGRGRRRADAADYPVLGSVGDISGDGVPDLWGRASDDTVTGWPGVADGTDWTAVGAAFTIADA